jgi:hypothetical protein
MRVNQVSFLEICFLLDFVLYCPYLEAHHISATPSKPLCCLNLAKRV